MTDPDEETRAYDESLDETSSADGAAPLDSRSSQSGAGRLGELESLSAGTGSGEYLAHFRILEEIGRGGMGTVYRAQDTLLDRQVAVKVLSERLSGAPEFQERFVREAKIIARMTHPGIPQIHFIGRAAGRLFFAMEWIDGRTLADLVRSEGRVPLERALEMTMQAAGALEAAHGRGIVHRDIKPANLMVTREGVVKVLDFGIARSVAFQGDATETGGFVGTPHYASPEQARGAPLDLRSDIYSLGATLFELLTGRPPFEGDNPLAVLTDRLVKPPPELPDEVARVPATKGILARMMAVRPEDRFPDCGALVAAMEEVLPAPPVPARAGRRAMAFLTDLLLVGIPVIGLFLGFWAIKGYFVTTVLYDSVAGRVILGLGTFAWLAVYFALLGGPSGATPGQRLMQLRLATRNGERLSPKGALLRVAAFWGPVCVGMAIQTDWPPVLVSSATGEDRYLSSNLPWVLVQFWLLSLGVHAWVSRSGRHLVDRIAGSMVVAASKVARNPNLRSSTRSWLQMRTEGSRQLIKIGVGAAWVAVAAFVVLESRDFVPWSPNPMAVYERRTTFETIRKGDPGWQRLSGRFLREFLSEGQTVTDSDVLTLERHPFLPLLYASPAKALVVESEKYGSLVLMTGEGWFALAGWIQYFRNEIIASEERQPADAAQARRWDEARRRLYEGSVSHFVRALMHRRLRSEGFEVQNPEDFVGLWRKGNGFVLVGGPEIRLRFHGKPRVLYLNRGWVHVTPLGGVGGQWGGWTREGEFLPLSVKAKYAAEQDAAWGRPTESIQEVLDLE